MSEMLVKLRGLRAEIVAITDSANREVDDCCTRVVRLPARVKEVLTPIPYIVPPSYSPLAWRHRRASIRIVPNYKQGHDDALARISHRICR